MLNKLNYIINSLLVIIIIIIINYLNYYYYCNFLRNNHLYSDSGELVPWFRWNKKYIYLCHFNSYRICNCNSWFRISSRRGSLGNKWDRLGLVRYRNILFYSNSWGECFLLLGRSCMSCKLKGLFHSRGSYIYILFRKLF